MFPEGNVWQTFIFLLLLTSGVPAEKICSVYSNHEVHMGSSFHIYCIFKKECSKLIYQDEVSLNYSRLNSTVVMMNIVNLTRTTTFTCKCRNEPEPCGTDIIPGYPPSVPLNLTCVQEGEFGKVNCTWKTGLETHVKTTSHLWVHGDPPVSYESVAVYDGAHSTLFPVSGTQSNFSVWVHANNSLGSANSTILSFTLNEIVKPLSPNIIKVECSSRECHLYLDNARNIRLIEIRYKEQQDRWSTISFNNTNSTTSWAITSLKPYSTYTFEVRWKFSPTRGLWSEWTRIKETTGEEAPLAMLDVWYTEEPSQTVSRSFQLFWKELSKSEARGKILQYIVTVTEHGVSKNETLLGTTITISCFNCDVKIFAMNSKGLSPARLLHLQPIAPLLNKVTLVAVNNHSVALSWPRPDRADRVTEFVVEWFPVGQKKPPQWIRVEPHLNTARITGLQPAVCYEGAVVYINLSEPKKAVFHRFSTWQTAPYQSPVPRCVEKSDGVEVKWSEVPPEKRGGCLENYTIYRNNSKGMIQIFTVKPPQREHTIEGLVEGGEYSLWVSAWTAAGESPFEYECKINIKNRDMRYKTLDKKPIIVGCTVFLACLSVLCLYQFSSVCRRLSKCCYCLMPSIVPDPANSKWAKECAGEKGEMKLHLHPSDSSMSEEEPNTVEVEEFPQEELPEDETSSTEDTLEPVSPQAESAPYQCTITSSYLKSFSNESSSSDATQASTNTDITVVYISTHEAICAGEEDDDYGDEEHQAFDFVPCPKRSFLEPLIPTGGKLTLDSVRIDCSDFLDCA